MEIPDVENAAAVPKSTLQESSGVVARIVKPRGVLSVVPRQSAGSNVTVRTSKAAVRSTGQRVSRKVVVPQNETLPSTAAPPQESVEANAEETTHEPESVQDVSKDNQVEDENKKEPPSQHLPPANPASKNSDDVPCTTTPLPKKPKRAMNAYMFFSEVNRARIKEENPSFSMIDVVKAMGNMWKEMSDEAKVPFKEMAEADKVRAAADTQQYESDMAKFPLQTKTSQKKPKRAKSAYQFFCDEKRSAIKSDNPGIALPEQQKILSKMWAEAGSEEKAKFTNMAKEEKTKLGITKKQTKNTPGKGVKRGAKLFRKALGLDGDESKESSDAENAKSEKDEEDEEEYFSDDPTGREKVDWGSHPAEHIVGQSLNGKYFVKRVGVDYQDYGTVDASKAKRQRLGGEAPDCPVDVEMIDDYEDFCKEFSSAVAERTTKKGILNLDDLEHDSPLEMCFYLGKLQELDGPLSAVAVKKKQDVMIRVPLLGISFVVQRILDLERSRGDDLEEEVAELKKKIALLTKEP